MEERIRLMDRHHLPKNLKDKLAGEGISLASLEIAIYADLQPDLSYGQEWFLAGHDSLYHYILVDGQFVLKHNFMLSAIEEVNIRHLTSTNYLEIKVGQEWLILAHFTNSRLDSFTIMVNFMRARAKAAKVPLAHLIEEGRKRPVCASCGLGLDSSGVCPKCLKKKEVFQRLLSLLRPYRGGIALILFLLLLGVAVDLAPPFLIRVLVDDVLKSGSHPNWLLKLVMGLIGLQIIRIIITIITNRLNANLGAHFTLDLRAKMFERLQELSVRYYDRHSIGSLMTRISVDTEELLDFISQATQGFLLNIFLIIGIWIVLFCMDWRLSLFVLVPVPLVMLATYYIWQYIRPLTSRYGYSRWRINAMLNSFLSGIRVVKAFAQEKRESHRFQEHNQELTSTRLTLVRSWHTFFPLISFVFGVGGFVIWYFGGQGVLSGRITLGVLLAFISYLGMFYGPFSSMTQLSQWLTRFVVASQRIFNILDQKSEIKVATRPTVLKSVEGQIEFKEVSFGYYPHLPVLNEVSFAINPGEVIGLVGKSGAGKSTIINLLCRFYDVTEGGIYLDGIDIRKLDPIQLRQHIGLVLQEPFLFRGTIAENIAYGSPASHLKDIIQAAVVANAHDFIMALPDGYDTRLGEGGAGISGGEKQRISIARAILPDPPLLILDEATTNLDVEAEAFIQKALKEVVKGRTTIIIAHRFTTIARSNRLMVIERGRLLEMGSLKELLEKKGRFYELYNLQVTSYAA